MKLYNLYQDLILEKINSELLRLEAMSDVDVDSIIAGDKERQGKFYKVNITYKSPNGEVSNRFIEIYQRNLSTAGNDLIDAYQLSKNNQPYEGWKKFRLDRIESFNVTGVAYYNPQNGFNPIGNDSPTVASTANIADIPSFGYKSPTSKNLDIKSKWQGVKQNRINKPKLTPTVKAPEIGPQTKQPEPQPVQQVQSRPLPKQNNNPKLPDEEDLINNL